MPTPPNGRPTDELLIDAARAHVLRLCGPGRVPRAIVIHVDGVTDLIKIPVLPSCCPATTSAQLPPAVEQFLPTEVQACILEALAGKALRTDALATAAGVNRSQVFQKPGGIRELMERGDVAHHKRAGYYRPDAPPDDLV